MSGVQTCALPIWGLGIEAVEKVIDSRYDYLIIAIDSKKTADKIRENLIQMHVPENKIVWDEYRKKRNQ